MMMMMTLLLLLLLMMMMMMMTMLTTMTTMIMMAMIRFHPSSTPPHRAPLPCACRYHISDYTLIANQALADPAAGRPAPEDAAATAPDIFGPPCPPGDWPISNIRQAGSPPRGLGLPQLDPYFQPMANLPLPCRTPLSRTATPDTVLTPPPSLIYADPDARRPHGHMPSQPLGSGDIRSRSLLRVTSLAPGGGPVRAASDAKGGLRARGGAGSRAPGGVLPAGSLEPSSPKSAAASQLLLYPDVGADHPGEQVGPWEAEAAPPWPNSLPDASSAEAMGFALGGLGDPQPPLAISLSPKAAVAGKKASASAAVAGGGKKAGAGKAGGSGEVVVIYTTGRGTPANAAAMGFSHLLPQAVEMASRGMTVNGRPLHADGAAEGAPPSPPTPSSPSSAVAPPPPAAHQPQPQQQQGRQAEGEEGVRVEAAAATAGEAAGVVAQLAAPPPAPRPASRPLSPEDFGSSDTPTTPTSPETEVVTRALQLLSMGSFESAEPRPADPPPLSAAPADPPPPSHTLSVEPPADPPTLSVEP